MRSEAAVLPGKCTMPHGPEPTLSSEGGDNFIADGRLFSNYRDAILAQVRPEVKEVCHEIWWTDSQVWTASKCSAVREVEHCEAGEVYSQKRAHSIEARRNYTLPQQNWLARLLNASKNELSYGEDINNLCNARCSSSLLCVLLEARPGFRRHPAPSYLRVNCRRYERVLARPHAYSK